MIRVAIVAPTGMLGSMVYNVLKDDFKLVLIYRNKAHVESLEKNYGKTTNHSLIQLDLSQLFEDYKTSNDIRKLNQKNKLFNLEVDYIVNCAGLIKPYANKNSGLTFFINSALPHLLSTQYEEKLIQITTDCVFSGVTGAPYDEKSDYSPTDLYGLSKSLGEPYDKSLVLRTSIIGPEINNFSSLISWFVEQKIINGFTNHFWNGITTKQFGKIIKEIILHKNRYPKKGIFHIFSKSVTKYTLLSYLKEKYNPSCEIIPFRANKIDRRLSSIFDLNKRLKIPSIKKQINEL